jgi:choline dehydrogenase-like flavoprotein
VLGDQTDIYGQPIPVVRHSCSSLDKASLIALHEILSKELTRNNLGQLHTSLTKAENWPIQLDSAHHIGTTRMGDNPETSVVNRDCQIHTVPNVYLAGSSVFPTSGCANPTYTIVALSIRLAEHLAYLPRLPNRRMSM